MKTVKISLNSIDKVKAFVNDVTKFNTDFDLVSGRYVIDAKSIMGIFSLDLSKAIDLNIHDDDNADRLGSLAQLPASCAQSADCLQSDRELYEAANVFPKAMIDGVIARLKAHNDADLAAQAHLDPTLMSKLVAEHFHCG